MKNIDRLYKNIVSKIFYFAGKLLRIGKVLISSQSAISYSTMKIRHLADTLKTNS